MTNLTHPAEVEAILTYVLERYETFVDVLAYYLNMAHPNDGDLRQRLMHETMTVLAEADTEIRSPSRTFEEIRTALEKARDMARKEMG